MATLRWVAQSAVNIDVCRPVVRIEMATAEYNVFSGFMIPIRHVVAYA